MNGQSGTEIMSSRPASTSGAELIQRLVDDVHNGHRLDRLNRYFRDGHLEHDPRVAPGPDGPHAFWRDLLTGFPDLTVTVDVVLADNDRVMTFMTWRGRQTGTFADRPPHGRDLELCTAELFRLDDDRIAEHWAVVDYSILRTFGLRPVRAPGPVRPGLAGPHDATERENTETVLAAYREILSEHRLDRAHVYYEHDYVHHNAQMPAVPNGVPAFVEYFAGNFAAFPDLTATVDHVVAAGDRVMVFATWRGHFTGLSRGRKPTGRRLLMYTSDVFRLAGGKVAEHWEVVDYSGLENVGMTVRPPVPA
jgi:predicted SnoaL-like aldol condensation-catalyzing enzyme